MSSTISGAEVLTWKTFPIGNPKEKVCFLSEQGMTQRDIAAEIGISPASVNRIIKTNKNNKVNEGW